uniref:Neurogenic locus Notch protein n=1 Tax=Haemonchus contortus TaxID=6289 RepID=A0A7I4Y307_HAECO
RSKVFRMYRALLLWVSCSVFVSGRELLHCPNDFRCHNNGVCDSNGRCICEPGWTGYMCEIEAVPCPDRPCENGICFTDQEGVHSCRCDHRFEGQYCELDKNECALKVCPADATCVNLTPKYSDDKGYSCICPEGYTGDLCDLEVDLCELHRERGENYCHNGGVCEARFVCMCQNGFGGPRCGRRVPRLEEYEEFGCPERAEVCAKLFDDGRCDDICNRESCLFDGFDCAKRDGAVCRHPSECAYKYGDSKCDDDCAGPECGYDGGDCDGNSATYSSDVNMIGVAIGVPPDIVIKNLRQLQSELAQRLYTHVSVAEDMDGIMVFGWGIDTGQGNRITVVDEDELDKNLNGTMVFFDVDTSSCRIRRRKGQIQPRCFTDLRAAATYLTLELTQSGPVGGEKLPIRDFSLRKKQIRVFPIVTSPVVLIILCVIILVVLFSSCTGIIVAIVRARRRRQTTVFAPCWKVPGPGNSLYHPPTPPYSCSPEHITNNSGVNIKDSSIVDKELESKDASIPFSPIVDAKSPLLMAVRRGDHEKVKEMISSKETFVDALLINCEQLDLFEKSSAGQSPLLFAARIAHPGLECVSLLVSAIDIIRKRRHDDVLSQHFEDLQKDR